MFVPPSTSGAARGPKAPPADTTPAHGAAHALKAMARGLSFAAGEAALSPADHKAARTGKKGRVGKLVSPASLATEPQLNAYVRKQLALVEFAKAGWAAAAKAIGGRVRANVRVPGQKRTTREVFPASIRKLANRYSSIGSAAYSISGSTHSLTIATHVKHAQEATNPGMMASAESRAQDSFTRAIAQSLQAMHRRLRRAA